MPRHATIHALVVLLAACTGLDPGAFQAKKSSSSDPEAAGWSFDAGPTPDGGRDGGTGGAGRASSGAPSAGRSEPGEGGAGGESDGGGTAGAMPDRGGAGTIRGGSGGGGAGGRALGGAPGAGSAGRSGAGSASGAAAGRSGAAGTGQGGAATRAFFFSEYVEGSSSYKALEITAREPSSFAGCRLVTYFNGSSSGSGILLDGALPGGSTYVLCTTALATLVGSACHRATNLTFNGDDALALECDGMLLDVIGQIGVDPGDGWGTGDASTLNHTLRRNCASSSGDRDGSDSFEPASEWSAFPADTFDGLGQAECGGG